MLEQAIACSTGEQAAASALLLGSAQERSGRINEAEAAYRRAFGLARELIDAPLKLGVLLQRQGRHAAVIEVLHSVLSAGSGSAPVCAMLAASQFATGDLSAAAESAGQAIALAPQDPAFVADLAVIRNAQGAHAEAEALCRRALKQREEPSTLNTLGVALKEQGRIEEAAASFERATAQRPDFAEALYNIASMRKDQGRTEEAIDLLRQVKVLAPDLAAARLAICTAHLQPIYTDEAQIERSRADYAAALATLTAEVEQTGAAALASGVGAAQPFYLAYQGQNDIELQRRHGAMVGQAMSAAFPPVSLAGPLKSGARLRLGIVCGYIRDHSVWRLPTRGWVEHLDRTRFELIGYHTGALRDAETLRAEALFDQFIQGPSPFEAWLARIAADRPHAIIYPELGMDSTAARLAALRLAPAQYVSWGHPTTSGYPTVDYFLSSDIMEPDDGAAHYTERLVRLPGLSTPVTLEAFSGPRSSRASLGLSSTATVYWCAQSLSKYLPQHDWVFAAIAQKLANSQFVFIDFPGSPALTQRFKDRLARAFSKCGLDAGAFCVWLPRLTSAAFLSAMGSADIVLDSIDWSGCNTLLDALRHGLPIVTMAGKTMRSRHGAAILSQLGRPDLICHSLSAYVDAAVALAEPQERASTALEGAIHRLADTNAIDVLEAHLLMSISDRTLAFTKGVQRGSRRPSEHASSETTR